jgi:hypothetical protein
MIIYIFVVVSYIFVVVSQIPVVVSYLVVVVYQISVAVSDLAAEVRYPTILKRTLRDLQAIDFWIWLCYNRSTSEHPY